MQSHNRENMKEKENYSVEPEVCVQINLTLRGKWSAAALCSEHDGNATFSLGIIVKLNLRKMKPVD